MLIFNPSKWDFPPHISDMVKSYNKFVAILQTGICQWNSTEKTAYKSDLSKLEAQ